MASKITLTFNQHVPVNSVIFLRIDILGTITDLDEVFKSVRTQHGEVGVSGTSAFASAYSYVQAFNTDYNSYATATLIINQSIIKVEIELIQENWTFDSAVISPGINYVINNETPQPPKTLEFSGFSSGGSVCDTIKSKFNITGGSGTYKLYVDNVLTVTGVSPLEIETNRAETKIIKVLDNTDLFIGQTQVTPPRKMIPNDIKLDIQNYNSGATINVNLDNSNPVPIELNPLSYSLDGVTYKSQNIFTGILQGSYTVYVKDSFGCVTTKQFIVDQYTTLTETVFFLSEINALSFAKANSEKKNIENTLSCNELRRLNNTFYHKYLEQDTIRTQFKTNAKELNIYTIDPKGNEKSLTPIKKTENIGLLKKSTMTYFSLGGGRSAVYFGIVDLLDPITNAFIETINLGFTLPEWSSKVGQLVTIDGIGELPIDEIGYSDFYDSFIAIFNVSYTGSAVQKTLASRYNLQPYEVYEFDINMALHPEQFKVVIEAGAFGNVDYAYVSESVKRVEDSEFLYKIQYKDAENKGGMVYQTGISHLLRLNGISDYQGQQETEGYNGDTEYNITDNQIYKTIKFIFSRLPSRMAHKLRLVMAHDNLVINGLSYKLPDSPEIQGNMNYNMKTFSVTLKNGGNQFLKDEQEFISGSAESGVIGGALEASKGKSLILWTKTNG